MHALRSFSLLTLLLIASGCSAPTGSWETVPESELNDAESTQLASAIAARDELAKNLMLHLLEGMQSGGAQTAIDVCKVAAPEVAAGINATKPLTIGRTSHRLRNPKNEAPAWAASFVKEERGEQVLLRHSGNGAFAALFPIKLQGQCLQCHGPEEQIAPLVRDALWAAYPEDKATGFSEGELRGWFHVTVPGPM
jgi:hypothetical protein